MAGVEASSPVYKKPLRSSLYSAESILIESRPRYMSIWLRGICHRRQQISSIGDSLKAEIGDSSSSDAIVERVVPSSGAVELPLLTKANYHDWALVMQVSLEALDLLDAVEAVTKDRAKDRRVLDAILRAVPSEMKTGLAVKTLAKEAWEAVKSMHVGDARVKAASVQRLWKEYENIAFRDGESVGDFCMRIQGLVRNLREMGEKLEDGRVVKKILRGRAEEAQASRTAVVHVAVDVRIAAAVVGIVRMTMTVAAARARGAVGTATGVGASTPASTNTWGGTARRRRRSARCSATSTRRRRCCEGRVRHVMSRGRLLGINPPWFVHGGVCLCASRGLCVAWRVRCVHCVMLVRVCASREAAATSGVGATRSRHYRKRGPLCRV
jgi:hypothetical protein